LLAFLLEPHSYPHRPQRVRLVQTHASYLLLVAPYVYKVKKPLSFGFLDFSTLENRRYFSEREVILNRRLCSRIYLGVVPISLNEGRLVFGPGDEVVEYAVKHYSLAGARTRDLAERTCLLAQKFKRIGCPLWWHPHEGVPRAMDHHSSGCLPAEKFPTSAFGQKGRCSGLRT
jgi:hypothetical protein